MLHLNAAGLAKAQFHISICTAKRSRRGGYDVLTQQLRQVLFRMLLCVRRRSA
jgi:hypothetical protein